MCYKMWWHTTTKRTPQTTGIAKWTFNVAREIIRAIIPAPLIRSVPYAIWQCVLFEFAITTLFFGVGANIYFRGVTLFSVSVTAAKTLITLNRYHAKRKNKEEGNILAKDREDEETSRKKYEATVSH